MLLLLLLHGSQERLRGRWELPCDIQQVLGDLVHALEPERVRETLAVVVRETGTQQQVAHGLEYAARAAAGGALWRTPMRTRVVGGTGEHRLLQRVALMLGATGQPRQQHVVQQLGTVVLGGLGLAPQREHHGPEAGIQETRRRDALEAHARLVLELRRRGVGVARVRRVVLEAAARVAHDDRVARCLGPLDHEQHVVARRQAVPAGGRQNRATDRQCLELLAPRAEHRQQRLGRVGLRRGACHAGARTHQRTDALQLPKVGGAPRAREPEQLAAGDAIAHTSLHHTTEHELQHRERQSNVPALELRALDERVGKQTRIRRKTPQRRRRWLRWRRCHRHTPAHAIEPPQRTPVSSRTKYRNTRRERGRLEGR